MPTQGSRRPYSAFRIGLLALALLVPAFIFVTDANAAGGGYSVKWAAADPAPNSGPYVPTYDKETPLEHACPTPSGGTGRSSGPIPDAVSYSPGGANDSVQSMAPESMALGQIVPFQIEVTVTAGANGDLEINPYFLTKTTNGGNFGYDPAYGVLCAFVDTGDPGTTDPGANAKVSSFSSTIGNVGTSNEQINGKINLSGLNPGDKVIVEVWVVLKDMIASGVTGNVQTGLTSAREPSSGDTVNTGNQTVPLLRSQDFFNAQADLSVTKTDSPDPVARNGTLTYSISVKNNSTTTVANGVTITDRLDPNTTFVSASGATCSVSSGIVTCNLGFVQPGDTEVVTITTVVSSSAPAGNDTGSGGKAGFVGTTCPASGVDLCNRVSVASAITTDPTTANNAYIQPTNVVTAAPNVTQSKSVTDLNGGEAIPGDVLEYSVTTSNTGAGGATGVVFLDPIPTDTTYVPGSITVAGTSRTDASGDDTAEYDSGANRVVARLGTGANSTTGGRLGPGQSATVTFRVTVGSPLPDDRLIKNFASASYFSEDDGSPGTATSSVNKQVGAPDLTPTKTRTSGPIVAGQDVTYDVAVKNVGDASTVGTVTLSDTLPAGLTIESVSGTGWNCAITMPRDFSCTRSDALAPGATYPVIAIRADTDPGLTGAVTNTAVVSGGSDINFDNNSSTDTTNAGHSADLVVTKSVAPGTIRVGEQATFTIVVKNDGPSKATNVGLDDPVPAGLEMVGNATTSAGSCQAGLVVCNLGDIAPGDSVTVTFTVRALSSAAGTTVNNVATAESTGAPDPTPGNNTDDADLVVRGVDLEIIKTIDPDPPEAGGPVTYSLLVRNNGPSDATGVVVNDPLPDELEGETVSDDGGADCSITAGGLLCNVGDLDAGDSLTIEVSGTVADDAAVIANTAAVNGNEIDEDPSNNTDTIEREVEPEADLSIEKDAWPVGVSSGDEVTYTLIVENHGPHVAENTEVTDNLPPGTSFVAATSGCSSAGATVTCDLGDLQPGETRMIVIRVAITNAAAGTLHNVAGVGSDTEDPDPSDNEDTADVQVVPHTDPEPDDHADLELKKTADKASASPGQNVTYTLTVTNHGPDNAHHVQVRDPLSPYLQFVSAQAGCTYANVELVCEFGSLNPGQTASRNVVLRIDPNYTSASVPTADLLDIMKVESFLSVQAGEYKQASLSCPGGYVMSDGTPRVDSVDQGSDPADVHFVRSETMPSNASGDLATYRFDIENHTGGQAQVHLFGVCVALQTTGNTVHTLGTPNRETGSIDVTDLPATAVVQKKLTCANPNHVAISPGFSFRTGAQYVHGPQLVSEQSPDGRSWTFAFEVGPKSATQDNAHIDLSIRCLPRTTSVNDGHQHALTFHHVYSRVAVGPHSIGEYRLSCPVGMKGIAATWDIPQGLKMLGHTPEPINRDFRILNTTGDTLYANLDLVCLRAKVGDELNGGDIMNTASVHGDEPDWNAGNNFSSWVLHDPPLQQQGGGSGTGGSGDSGGGSAGGDGSGSGSGDSGSGTAADGPPKNGLRVGDAVTQTRKTAMVPLYGGGEATEGTVTLLGGKTKYGSADFELDAGEDTFVDVKLGKKARKLLKNRRFIVVTIDTGDETTEHTLRVEH